MRQQVHPQAEAVQEALPAQLAAVGLHAAVHLPVGREQRGKRVTVWADQSELPAPSRRNLPTRVVSNCRLAVYDKAR